MDGEDEFSLFFRFLDKLKESNLECYTILINGLPFYIVDLCKILRSWKRIRTEKTKSESTTKPRKILTVRRAIR